MNRILIAGLAILPLTACGPSTVRIPIAFDESEARAMLAPGANQVTGTINLELENGSLVTCAGNEVSLVPATAYAREWVRQFYEIDKGQYGTMAAAYRLDDREDDIRFAGAEAFYTATRSARCDEDGDFSFAHIGNGEFFVVAKAKWLGKNREYYDFMYNINDAEGENGSIMERIRLSGHDVIDLQWAPRGPGLLDGEGLAKGR
jgi:hypothetical protein